MDAPTSRTKVTPYRAVARNWRTSSARRAGKLGRVLENVPSIDEVEADILARDKLCTYCGIRIQIGRPIKTRLTMDHLQPVSRGGDASLANLGLCCPACNGAKGPLNESEFRELLALISTWEDGGKALLIRLRGGFWAYAGGNAPGAGGRKGVNLGRKPTPEALVNMTLANQVPRTPETIQKMSEAKRGSRNPWFQKDLSRVRAAKKDVPQFVPGDAARAY